MVWIPLYYFIIIHGAGAKEQVLLNDLFKRIDSLK